MKQTAAEKILSEEVDRFEKRLESWRKPSECLLFETVRGIDHLFCEELFSCPNRPSTLYPPFASLALWGVNRALSLVMPTSLEKRPFKLFRSTDATQGPTNQFLFECGVLEKAEVLRRWLRNGLLAASVDHLTTERESGIRRVITLTQKHPSMLAEAISLTKQRWVSDVIVELDRPKEEELETIYLEILPDLVGRWELRSDGSIRYTTSDGIDEHFLEWGKLYLRRMWGQDLIGLEEKVGGNQYNEYLGVMVGLAARAQRHLAFVSIALQKYPELDLRNLLTTFAPRYELERGLARFLDADLAQVSSILNCLTLTPQNKATHLASGNTAYAPLIRVNESVYILPVYGLEINPFMFLLNELRERYPADWFTLANNREARWLKDMHFVFSHFFPQLECRDTIILKENNRRVTDIDFLALDPVNKELVLFQLKWQEPLGADQRRKSSFTKNLISTGNKWASSVRDWLNLKGVEELLKRAGLDHNSEFSLKLIVLARYRAFFSMEAERDPETTWADWNHMQQCITLNPEMSVVDICLKIEDEIEKIKKTYRGEAYVLPLHETAVILKQE